MLATVGVGTVSDELLETYVYVRKVGIGELKFDLEEYEGGEVLTNEFTEESSSERAT